MAWLLEKDTPSPLSPMATLGGCFSAQLTLSAASTCSAWLPQPGRAGETLLTALGLALAPANNRHHSAPEKPGSILHTLQSCSVGVQARSRLGSALPTAVFKQ